MKCKKCIYKDWCDTKKEFKKLKKKCKKLNKKSKRFGIVVSCNTGIKDSGFDDVFNDEFSSFDNEFDDVDTNTDDTDTENSDSNNSSLDTHDNITKSLSELELLNKNIESLINILQNKLK